MVTSKTDGDEQGKSTNIHDIAAFETAVLPF
jgi:hypothetical protein